jgi:type IV pilus assembly protein PilM
MASANAVWGIDIGQCALKAIKLRPAEDGKVEAVAFDVIEHPKILSQPDADRDELISSALEKFASRNDWQGDKFVVGVPGQQTFARFCKMPPIDLKKDAKKIHDLVRYEASQQIPFDIDEVVWDYQIFTHENNPDIEVGIFAIRKDLIRKHLEFFSKVRIAPMGVQTIPAALYNFCQFDGQLGGEGTASIVVDVGAQNTDLIIVEPNSAWTRNIPLGGNSFTEALVRSFKLSFAKAESLKRQAATSKYARQIFQAMRPVFADLVAEIQRSIGFYSSTHRDVELKRVLALGSAFRLPGLQKYLENNLTMKVVKLEQFSNLVPTATTNAPQFTENVISFAPAYGLALQGLGLAKIRANLLPAELARIAVWQRKRPYFIASAAALVLAAGIPYIANALDMQTLQSERVAAFRRDTDGAIREAKKAREEFGKAKLDAGARMQEAENLLKLQDQKVVLPRVITLVHEGLPPVNPPELAKVESAEEMKKLIASDPAKFDRRQRGKLIVESLKLEYVPNVDTAVLGAAPQRAAAAPTGGGMPPGGMMPPGGGRGVAPGNFTRGRGVAPSWTPPPQEQEGPKNDGKGGAAGFIVRVDGRLLYGKAPHEAARWLTTACFESLREWSQQPGLGFFIPPDDPKENKQSFENNTIMKYFQSGGDVGLQAPFGAADRTNLAVTDPVTGEDCADDWRVSFAFKVKLGEPPKEAASEGEAAPEEKGKAGGAAPEARGKPAAAAKTGGGARERRED